MTYINSKGININKEVSNRALWGNYIAAYNIALAIFYCWGEYHCFLPIAYCLFLAQDPRFPQWNQKMLVLPRGAKCAQKHSHTVQNIGTIAKT